MNEEPAIPESAELLAADTTVFAQFLAQYGLPCDNVIAVDEERRVIAQNLPVFLNSLPAEEKRYARYLSKFVGATAIGLFDAALNYVWNEVVLNLQKKAVIYGLDLFFDAAVGGDRREFYSSEDDFRALKDRVIIDTFRKLELISDVVYHKLEHILTMRNEVAASHPNVEQIGGYELLGWLQTCVKDILQDRPSESAIKVTALIGNLRGRTDVLDANTVAGFEAELENLSPPHVHNLLITIFGMYVAEDTEATLRKNISLIAPKVWTFAAARVKQEVGERIAGYRTNLQQAKLEKGVEFLHVVDGLNFETLPQREIALTKLASDLRETHFEWDNFHHEPAVARQILAYCKKAEDISPSCIGPLAEIVIRCRLGNGVNYCNGVSPGAAPLYEQFLSILDDAGIKASLFYLGSPEILQKLSYAKCRMHLPQVLEVLREHVISDRLRDAIDLIASDPERAITIIQSHEFRELMEPLQNG